MEDKNNQQQSPAMVEDKATEELKKHARDLGLIVNAGADQKQGTIASQTKTTRNLDNSIKRAAEDQMSGRKRGSRK